MRFLKASIRSMALILCLSGCAILGDSDISPRQAAAVTSPAVPDPTPSSVLVATPNAAPTVTLAPIVSPFTVDHIPTVTPITLTPRNTPTLAATLAPVAAGVSLTPSPGPLSATEFVYVFPIQPPEAASYNPGHHDYPATDIVAPYRSEFVAVTGGIIDELSRTDTWDPTTNDPALRGGRYVSLLGDDGVRYYGSHLDEVASAIEDGSRVRAGTLLGFVGNSGNARGLVPHLHFGISHPTFPGDWAVRRGELSPYPYLQAWSQGENLIPEISPYYEPGID
ncbi:MAG: peptidoglycan DD-metalloendopeptidase family protein [Chloroflexota bacterium]|nr:MAG: peptidoglycan DD-metalloendopeptidase family protein [Chloroflexota bacterium]